MAHRAEQKGGEATASAVADDDQRCVARLVQQHLGRMTLRDSRLALERRLRLLRCGERVPHRGQYEVLGSELPAARILFGARYWRP